MTGSAGEKEATRASEPADLATRKELKRQRRQEDLAAGERHEAADRQRRRQFWVGGGLAVVLAIGGLGYWLWWPASAPGGLPGPLGGPSIAQDVNTLVGQPAPAFTVSDSEGTGHTVTPGKGRPLVLIFHMGIT